MWVVMWLCDLCGWLEIQVVYENFGKVMQGKVCDSRIFLFCVVYGIYMGCYYVFDNYIDISCDEVCEIGVWLFVGMCE